MAVRPREMFAADIAERLRSLRRSAGFTQEQLAVLAGITRVAYVNIESGQAIPKCDTLAALALILGVTANDILGADYRNYVETTMIHRIRELAERLPDSTPTARPANTRREQRKGGSKRKSREGGFPTRPLLPAETLAEVA